MTNISTTQLDERFLDYNCLKLDDVVPDIPALLLAIHLHQPKTNIQIPTVQIPFPRLDRRPTRRDCLLEEIGRFPALEMANLECYGMSRQDLQDFVALLQRNRRPPLQECCVWDWHLHDNATLDHLVMVLSSFQFAHGKIALGVENGGKWVPVLNESSLVMLCHNPRLTSLR